MWSFVCIVSWIVEVENIVTDSDQVTMIPVRPGTANLQCRTYQEIPAPVPAYKCNSGPRISRTSVGVAPPCISICALLSVTSNHLCWWHPPNDQGHSEAHQLQYQTVQLHFLILAGIIGNIASVSDDLSVGWWHWSFSLSKTG